MQSKDRLVCTNCQTSLAGKRQVFQGVIICDNCYKMVSHSIKRTQEELKMLFLVYTDMIRVSLLKGEFRPPVLPPSGKKLPQEELVGAFRELAKRGEEHGRKSGSAVSSMQRDQENPDGEVRDG